MFVALTSPSGGEWTWGDPAAADSVRGPALDFCLLVTQRRVLDDLDLEVTGDAAAEWMSHRTGLRRRPVADRRARRGL